jgi:ubiquinone/menaquinone biosynthesis C-methylase UbiE
VKDLWTHSDQYRHNYQTDDDVQEILALLQLDHARDLVDIGCGNGAFAIAAAMRYPVCRVWAFDALESAVTTCRDNAREASASNLAATVAWANDLPLGDASADRALCRSVLHHLAEPDSVYREIARMLRPGGCLVLQTPCNYWEPAFGDLLAELMMRIDDSHPRFYYSPADITSGLERAGFDVSAPDCWTYAFPFLSDVHAEFVREHGTAAARLRLRNLGENTWCIDNYWARVVATRKG